MARKPVRKLLPDMPGSPTLLKNNVAECGKKIIKV